MVVVMKALWRICFIFFIFAFICSVISLTISSNPCFKKLGHNYYMYLKRLSSWLSSLICRNIQTFTHNHPHKHCTHTCTYSKTIPLAHSHLRNQEQIQRCFVTYLCYLPATLKMIDTCNVCQCCMKMLS